MPLLAITAVGLELFVGNVTYFNTRSYEPVPTRALPRFQHQRRARRRHPISLDSDRTYLRFLNVDRPIYNLRFDGLVSDDPRPPARRRAW